MILRFWRPYPTTNSNKMKRSFILIFTTIFFCITFLRNDISVLALAVGPPILGIGAVFRPRNVKFVKSSEKDGDALDEAGKFFVDAFW